MRRTRRNRGAEKKTKKGRRCSRDSLLTSFAFRRVRQKILSFTDPQPELAALVEAAQAERERGIGGGKARDDSLMLVS